MRFARMGAVCYIAWGLLHLKAAADEFALGASLEPGLVQGKINQGGWDLLVFALAGILIAVLFNWKNDALGYWLNLAVVSAADMGFVVFVFIPGYVAVFPGILGPFFWICAAVFSSIGYRRRLKEMK